MSSKLIYLAAAVCLCATALAADIVYAYDTLGRVIQVDYPSGQRVCYKYDAANNITAVTTITTATACP